MSTVNEHYAKHLAGIYVWMAGGVDAAIARGESEINLLCPSPVNGLIAIDLGAGFGMHAIPLARRGYAVVALDSSPLLLKALRDAAGSLSIRCVEDDLLAFTKYLDTKADLILCMGDTLTHLSDQETVVQLFMLIATALCAGGRFVVTLRDYTVTLIADQRFIPVKSDTERILTCFLEYAPDYVTVHDVLHERQGLAWQLRVSSYRKLRLSPAWIAAKLVSVGLAARIEPGVAGMIRIIATRT